MNGGNKMIFAGQESFFLSGNWFVCQNSLICSFIEQALVKFLFLKRWFLFLYQEKNKEEVCICSFCLDAKRTKKIKAKRIAPHVLPAHAHEQSGKSINHYFIKLEGRRTCFVLFETTGGAVTPLVVFIVVNDFVQTARRRW